VSGRWNLEAAEQLADHLKIYSQSSEGVRRKANYVVRFTEERDDNESAIDRGLQIVGGGKK
jgi:hypothetical protein